MATGVIYITTTSVNGLIKIGKTRTDQFNNRMNNLEQNGYWNVSGLKRYFAVEVEDFDEKEYLLHTIFSKSRVANSELFALDKELAKEMLLAFDGRQIFPPLKQEVLGPAKSRNRKENLTFEMLGIEVGTELVYTEDNSVVVKVADNKNKIEYNGEIYTMTGFVKHMHGGGSWQGSYHLLYNGKRLTEIRDEMDASK